MEDDIALVEVLFDRDLLDLRDMLFGQSPEELACNQNLVRLFHGFRPSEINESLLT
jgi:hypothetical protein